MAAGWRIGKNSKDKAGWYCIFLYLVIRPWFVKIIASMELMLRCKPLLSG